MPVHDLILSERQFFVDLLGGLENAEWQAGTLCAGWTVEDLAAHLVVRERDILSAPGIVVPKLGFLHDRAIAKAKSKGHTFLLEKLATVPLPMRYFGANVNEFFVHNEDALRGGLGRRRPAPTGELAEALWQNAGRISRLNLVRVRADGVVAFVNSATGEAFARRVGSWLVRDALPEDADVTLRGQPGELLLYLFGRRGAADVTVDVRDASLLAALEHAKLGI